MPVLFRCVWVSVVVTVALASCSDASAPTTATYDGFLDLLTLRQCERLAQCDANEDSWLEPSECCDPALGGAPGCDPYMQPGLSPVARHDRHPMFGPEGACACEEGQPDACADAIDAWCEAPLGSGSDPGPESPAGSYAVPLVIMG